MQQPTKLIEIPEPGNGDLLFTLKDITIPESPRLKQPFTVKGKVELFKIPFLAPIWVRAKVTYPEAWWEEIVPIIGAPTVIESDIAIGSDFEISFPRGFAREGEFVLEVEAYAGPTFSVAEITIPPFPPVTSFKTTFIVAGEVPPEEMGFRNFRILSYSKNGDPPVTPPGALALEVGDRCRVNVGFDHMGDAVTGEFHAAIWKWTLIDPHDEQLSANKTLIVPSSVDWEPLEGYIDVIITSAISPGSEYGLYVKIMGITGGDIFTEYLENVITIIGLPPASDIADWDFIAVGGTYGLGATVPFTANFKYKGMAQGGRLIISLGTGIYPTFNVLHTYSPVTVQFQEAADWATGQLNGTFVLPATLVPGQTYSVRARLETNDGSQEIDTDWGVFTIAEEVELETLEVRIDPVGAGYVTTSPAPSGGTQHNWLFPYGTTVYVTAHPNPGYVFDGWSGEMTDTPAITAPVYPMTEHRLITAHFVKAEAPPVGISFGISIWGIPSDFGSYDEWCCFYWDPGKGAFVGGEYWYLPYERIPFANVQTGGYLAVFLIRGSVISAQYTSPTFSAVDGGVYQFDVELGRVSKIG
ncbi:MAG TPA: hypothetical protein VMV84_02955 [Dehalococcoidales bacterium]|nr:hypothetical protein [Dehalococcoidales bacterium]